MKNWGLNIVCAALLLEFVGFSKGCRDCGRFNDLPFCSFCLSQLCDKHMLPCHLCIRNGDGVFGGVVRNCCVRCACSWCHRGVCEEHTLKCKCGNHICFIKGRGGRERCPTFCTSNKSVPPNSHEFFCKIKKPYLHYCPKCKPKLPPSEQCGFCRKKIQ